jgi:outer membrane protein OmpA-like peptidoglycan-associated protein
MTREIGATSLQATIAGAQAIAVRLIVGVLFACLAFGPTGAQDEVLERTDYLTFAHGAVPIAIAGAGASLGADYEAAVRITDGDRTGFAVVDRAPADTVTEFVYELPALTTFDRFAVPEIRETPSPSATFTRLVEVHGSSAGPDDGYELLATGTLASHAARGEVTELTIVASPAVRWVRLRLEGGIDVQRDLSSFEFSEIIGNGVQDSPDLATGFAGNWRRAALKLRLEQDGPLVSGCYDSDGILTGNVAGNILKATGTTPAGIPSAFILSVAPDGSIRGVRSANNGPFRLYEVPAVDADDPQLCGEPPTPEIGCGSILHGVSFAFDSAEIRPESEPVLAALHAGLESDTSASILIEGHTSSEGAEAYNQALSERRAAAVVDDLVARGLAPGRIASAGIGEVRPIASNNDESGRALNRRVEVHCR